MNDLAVFYEDWKQNTVFIPVVLMFYLFLMPKVGSKV